MLFCMKRNYKNSKYKRYGENITASLDDNNNVVAPMASIHPGNYNYNKFKDKNQFIFDAYCYYGQSFYFEAFNFLIDTISLVLGSLRLLKRVLYYCPYRLEGEKTLEHA